MQLSRLFGAAVLLVAAAGCPRTSDCSSDADCADADPVTIDTCNSEGACEHAPVCVGDACRTDPCSPVFPVAGGLKVAVLDVGQGDSIAVIAPSGCAALIDGGPSGSGATVRSFLRSHGVPRLDFAVASHYHTDHVDGLLEVEGGSDPVSIATVYDRGDSDAVSTAFQHYAAAFDGRRQTVAVGQSWTLCGEVCFRVVGVNANGAGSSDENALSVVLKLNYGAFTMLLGGDLVGDVEASLRSRAGEVDVYKVHHHGSATSSTRPFLASLRPSVSLISVGWDNSFGHPSAEAVERLRAIESGLWLTEDSTHPLGPVEVDVGSEGAFTVSQGASSVEYAVKPAR